MKKMFLNNKILILGSDGQIGKDLFAMLEKSGANVFGTSRHETKSKKKFDLDLEKNNSIESFPWDSFDIIINCTGNIDYTNSPEAAQKNITINAIAPLKILTKLSKKHTYYHLSTHVTKLPAKIHNTYSLSKLFIEENISIIKKYTANVIILRIPGIFCNTRKKGVINLIKEKFYNKEALNLDFKAYIWHVMYLPRLIQIIVKIIKKNPKDKIIDIGYPLESNIKNILNVAKKSFDYSIPIKFINNTSDNYIPNTTIQNKYIKISEKDFEEDLIEYFKE